MIFLLAAIFAMVVGLLDFASSEIGFAKRAILWLILRLCADGAVGAATVFPVRAAYQHLPLWVSALIAATAGTALLRSYLLTLGSGPKSTQAGPIWVYDQLKSLTNKKISSAVSVAKVTWLTKTVTPALVNQQCDFIINQVMAYIENEYKYERRKLASIEGDLKLTASKNSQDRLAFYQRIVSYGARAELKELVKTAAL